MLITSTFIIIFDGVFRVRQNVFWRDATLKRICLVWTELPDFIGLADETFERDPEGSKPHVSFQDRL